MRTLLILCYLGAALTVSAQQGLGTTSLLPKSKIGTTGIPKPILDRILKTLSEASVAGIAKKISDTIVIGDQVTPIDRMPNLLPTKPSPPIYKGNNDQGFDIYESSVDKMPVLMPDSANKASLKYGSVKKIPGIYQMPAKRIYLMPRGKNLKRP